MMIFGASILIGSILIFMSFGYLPFIVIFPQKFSALFTLGSCSIMYGIGIMKGWKNFLTFLIDQERRYIFASYVITIIANIYFAMISKSYIIVLFLSLF